MIGSPIVFQTAPPQPWSNALATWPYVFVGGPDANQNGFGLSIPAKFVRRSAIPPPTARYRPLPPSITSIFFAAATPSAAAFTISAPPFAQSPPTKTFGRSLGHVSSVREPCPIATITMSHGIVSLPLAVRTSTPATAPDPLAMIRCGAALKRKPQPSRLARDRKSTRLNSSHGYISY